MLAQLKIAHALVNIAMGNVVLPFRCSECSEFAPTQLHEQQTARKLDLYKMEELKIWGQRKFHYSLIKPNSAATINNNLQLAHIKGKRKILEEVFQLN